MGHVRLNNLPRAHIIFVHGIFYNTTPLILISQLIALIGLVLIMFMSYNLCEDMSYLAKLKTCNN